MSFVNIKQADGVFIWLRRATLVVAVIMAGWGASVLLGKPVTAWFAASAAIWIALLAYRSSGLRVSPLSAVA